MRTVSAALLGALVGLFDPSAALAGDLRPNAQEQELVALFGQMTDLAASGGMAFDVTVDTSPARGPSPTTMAYRDGVCTLTVAVRGNANYQAMLATRGAYSRQAKLHAILGHEMGHCFTRHLEAQGARARAAALAPLTPQEERDDEVRADLFAMAWAAVYNPAEFDQVYGYLQELRADLSDDAGRFFATPDELAQGLDFRPVPDAADPRLLAAVATTAATQQFKTVALLATRQPDLR
jgi:hypothetical protein